MLVQLIYISTPIEEHRASITKMVNNLQERNRLAGVNGILLMHDHFYLQLLEGERSTVNKIYNRIVSDYRHANVTLLKYHDTQREEFVNWNLAVLDSSTCSEENCSTIIAGSIDINDESLPTDIAGNTAISILRRAYTVATVQSAPNRRKTDLANIHGE